MRNFIFILFIILFFGGLSSSVLAQSFENSEAGDLRALMDIYHATDGDNWFNTRDGIKPWDMDATSLPDETEWFGVTTEIIGGERRVIHLDLQRGTHSITSSNSIPDNYGNNLNNAVKVGDNWELAEGRELPESIGNLKFLRYLNLKHNTLRGPVPNGVTNLVNAERILLAGHPREPQYGTGINAPSNHPTATGIPSSEGVSKAAQALNYFEGSIPENVGNLQKLEIFELSFSGISGQLPAQFGALPELRMLILHGNSLNGNLPKEIGNAKKLRHLFLHSNNITGEIPGTLGDLSDMKHLRLSNNKFTGVIPTELGKIKNLRFFSIANNPFDPQPFPEFLLPREGHNQYLDGVLFRGINLVGTMPQDYDVSQIMENRLNVFNIADNNLSGSIPNWLTQHNIINLNLSNNQFDGELPSGFFDKNSRLFERLRNLSLFRNNLEGPLPNVDFGPYVRHLNLHENNFSGSIPAEWGNMETAGRNTGLTIRLHRNNLSGKIPVEVAHITMISPGKLLGFDISSNRFHSSDIEDFERELYKRHPDVDFDKSNQSPIEDEGTDSPPSSPSLSSPSNGSTNISLSPVLGWSASEGAESYRVQVARNSEFSNPDLDRKGLTAREQSLSGLNYETTYFWRVSASNSEGESEWSSVWSFTTRSEEGGDGDLLSAPTQVAPANESGDVSSTPTFEWKDVDADFYILHVSSTNPSKMVIDIAHEGTSYTPDLTLRPDTEHHWRVRGVKDGVEGEWSTIGSFTTASEADNGNDEDIVFTPISPENNQQNVELKSEFEWEPVQGAEQYRIELQKAETSEQITSEQVTKAEYSMKFDLDPKSSYKWRVQVIFSDGTASNWSESWIFKTGNKNRGLNRINMRQNYPNPFNPNTNIQFSVSETQEVSLKVYDMAGRLVATLFNGSAQGGAVQNVSFNATSLASGIYFYRLITDSEIVTRKMTLMK